MGRAEHEETVSGTLARSARGSARARTAWIILAAAAAGLRSIRLEHGSLWLDEILEVFTTRFSWSAMWRTLQRGVYNPPLDYAIRKIIEAFHPSEGSRRLAGVAWGVCCVTLFGTLIARRSNRAVGLCAALLLAFAPWHVRYSQEVRPYSLALLLLCASLLLLDRCLERPTPLFLVGLALAAAATAYALYLAALTLLVAGGALVAEELASRDLTRRENALRFLRRAPLLAAGALAVYAPWLSTLASAIRSPGLSSAPPVGWERAARTLGYFGFAGTDWRPFDAAAAIFLFLVVAGGILAVARFRLAFLAVWAAGGLLAVEWLERRHPVYDSVFHELPAGLAQTGLAAVPIGWLLSRPRGRVIGIFALTAVVVLDLPGLRAYFQRGRPDWRPLAAFLRATPAREPILVDSDYTRLCLGFYVVGPDWLCCPKTEDRTLVVVRPAEAARTAFAGRSGWLVVAGDSHAAELFRASGLGDGLLFEGAEGEGGARVAHVRPP